MFSVHWSSTRAFGNSLQEAPTPKIPWNPQILANGHVPLVIAIECKQFEYKYGVEPRTSGIFVGSDAWKAGLRLIALPLF